jgi:predicted metal-dependent hydrolase
MAALPDIDYSIRRSDRARRVRVSVDAEKGVEVILPRRASEKAAAAAVVELRPWIERRLREVEAAREQIAAREGTVPYLGETLTLVPQAGRTRVHRRGDELLVPAGDPREALERWYRRMAREEIEPRLDMAVRELGTRYTKLTIRNQKTRWGSCSSTGAMSFNWRLLLGPEEVLDYVVWHEACHLKVMDHSPRFWALVANHMPAYPHARRWLRRHGGTLVL